MCFNLGMAEKSSRSLKLVSPLAGAVRAAARDRATRVINEALPPSDGSLTLGEWLNRIPEWILDLQDENLDRLFDGIWCGVDGRTSAYCPSYDLAFVVGWHNWKVEYAYAS